MAVRTIVVRGVSMLMPAHASSVSAGQRKTPAGEAGVLRLVS